MFGGVHRMEIPRSARQDQRRCQLSVLIWTSCRLSGIGRKAASAARATPRFPWFTGFMQARLQDPENWPGSLKEQQDCSSFLSTSAPPQALVVERALNRSRLAFLRQAVRITRSRDVMQNGERGYLRLSPSTPLSPEEDRARRFATAEPAPKVGRPTVGAVIPRSRPEKYLASRGNPNQSDVFAGRRQGLRSSILRAGVADVLHCARQKRRRCEQHSVTSHCRRCWFGHRSRFLQWSGVAGRCLDRRRDAAL